MGITSKQRGRHLFPDGSSDAAKSYAADGTIAGTAGAAYLTKAGIGAYVLAAPAADGIRLTLVNRTANAHVVTATGLIDDGVTGGSKNQATFAAFAGATAEFMSGGGKWNVVSLKAVTVP